MNKAIVWFRQDLRLHDNEAITNALNYADDVLYVYVFEDTFLKEYSSHGFRRTGAHRLKFITEAVHDLRNSLRAAGADLIVRCGRAEDEIFKLAGKHNSSIVFCNRESTFDEVQIQEKLERKLWTERREIHFSRGKMLYHTQDLPFPVSHTPDQFKQFRKEVEKLISVRRPLVVPDNFKYTNELIPAGEIPELKDYGYESVPVLPYSAYPFSGGESAGLARLNYYVRKSNLLNAYSDTRLELSGLDYSSKLSAYLAQGCLSPKTIFYEIQAYEDEFDENKSTYELKLDLLWRDFLRLKAKKHKNALFYKCGLVSNEPQPFEHDQVTINNWTNGMTGEPYIDAIMKELRATGFISIKCRQIAAAYFVHELRQNWQIGAEYFESQLIDYDVCSNWGNWNNIAATEKYRQEIKSLNLQTLAQKYDPDGLYLDHWSQHSPLKKYHPGMLAGK